MGEIIYWGLIRFVAVVFGAWLLYTYVPNYGDWWTMFFVGVAVLVIYPAQIAFRRHTKEVRRASMNPLCATCKHFEPEATLCALLDLHVTKNYTPCEGAGWEARA
jgi:uncharacterized membrane protein